MPKIVKIPRALKLNGKSTKVSLESELWAKVDAVSESYGMTWQALLNQAHAEYAPRMMSVENAAKMLIDKLLLEFDTSELSLHEFDTHPLCQSSNTWVKADISALLEDPEKWGIRLVEGEADYGGFVVRYGYYGETPIMVILNQLGDRPSMVFTLGSN
ncbi:ribbon-helix-helix domain-containing protein [Chitinibacter sp. SCUT-21]|uniref:ribbon-helix-helix domain-containing protein n=1 Tax=Chitinibacter sp. SCUT-21 TaxID=2970891 RepID=UPI0035A6E8A3